MIKQLVGNFRNLEEEKPPIKCFTSQDLFLLVDGKLYPGHIHLNDCVYTHGKGNYGSLLCTFDPNNKLVGASTGYKADFVSPKDIWWIFQTELEISQKEEKEKVTLMEIKDALIFTYNLGLRNCGVKF